MTVTVPTTITAANEHTLYNRRNKQAQPLQKKLAPWQAGYFAQSTVAATVEQTATVGSPKPLRKQVQPTVRINFRRRITDALNSPFNYEMTEAARVVL